MWNVRDSDAIVIFILDVELEGYSLTKELTEVKWKRPCLLVSNDQNDTINCLTPIVLNVDGPRESEQPGMKPLSTRFWRSIGLGASHLPPSQSSSR